MHRILLLTSLLVLACGAATAAEEPAYYIITYTPGPAWKDKVAFDSQAGMKARLGYITRLHADDVVLMEGPLVGRDGALMLIRTASLDQANTIAAEDPAVINKTLKAKVTGWRVELSSMRQYRRVIPEVHSPNEPFKVERLDPQAPINLKGDKTR